MKRQHFKMSKIFFINILLSIMLLCILVFFNGCRPQVPPLEDLIGMTEDEIFTVLQEQKATCKDLRRAWASELKYTSPSSSEHTRGIDYYRFDYGEYDTLWVCYHNQDDITHVSFQTAGVHALDTTDVAEQLLDLIPPVATLSDMSEEEILQKLRSCGATHAALHLAWENELKYHAKYSFCDVFHFEFNDYRYMDVHYDLQGKITNIYFDKADDTADD